MQTSRLDCCIGISLGSLAFELLEVQMWSTVQWGNFCSVKFSLRSWLISFPVKNGRYYTSEKFQLKYLRNTHAYNYRVKKRDLVRCIGGRGLSVRQTGKVEWCPHQWEASDVSTAPPCLSRCGVSVCPSWLQQPCDHLQENGILIRVSPGGGRLP